MFFQTSDETHFIYEMENNNTTTDETFHNHVRSIVESGGHAQFKRISGMTFFVNLSTIDSLLPHIVAEMLLYSFASGITSVTELVDVLKTRNPLNYIGLNRSPGLYEQKVKRFLFAIVQGLSPIYVWSESPNVKQHYGVEMENGEKVVFSAYEIDLLMQFLLSNAHIDTRLLIGDEYGSEGSGEGYLYFRLTLQMRMGSKIAEIDLS